MKLALKKATPVPSTRTCLFRIVVLLIIIIVFFAVFSLVTAIENWQHPTSQAIQMVSPSCGTIIQTDGSLLCQNTGLDPTDSQLYNWLHTGHTIGRQEY